MVYSPALTDFVIMAEHTSFMFITGPEVIKAVTGEEVTAADLGGPVVDNSRSGVAEPLAESEPKAIGLVKVLLSYLPQNNTEDARMSCRTTRPTGRTSASTRWCPTRRTSRTRCTR